MSTKKSMLDRYLNSRVHMKGMSWAKDSLGLNAFGKNASGGILRFLGPAFTAYAGYEGFKEGGITGAAMGVGKAVAQSYIFGGAFNLATRALIAGGAATGIAAVGAGAWMAGSGIGIRQLARPWVRDHMRRHAKLELGTPIVDDYGTIATMRQRSLAAIQNSRLNGRTGLGNEAMLMYTPYHR